MALKNVSNNAIKDILIVDDPEVIKLIFSKKHNMILQLVREKDMSISDIARSLHLNPGSVHYHLKDLEKHGLVKQVREEIKGGIVKKYYHSVARRILLDSPNFNDLDNQNIVADEYIDSLIKSVEYLGYQLPPDNAEDAKELLSRYDKRIKDLLIEMHNAGLEDIENDGYILKNAYHLILNIRAKDDPELGRIYREFDKLFLRYG